MKTRLGIIWAWHEWKPGENCHLETLLCPGCGSLQTATVPRTSPEPYRLHRCGCCGQIIGRERWQVFEGNPTAIFDQNQNVENMKNIGCEHPNPVTYRASNGLTKGCPDCGQLLGGIWNGQPFGLPVDDSECIVPATGAPGNEGQPAPSGIEAEAMPAPSGCFICAERRAAGDWPPGGRCDVCQPARKKAVGVQTRLF